MHLVKCPVCGGSGDNILGVLGPCGMLTCDYCKGRGEIPVSDAEDEQRLREKEFEKHS